jgi:hypothetical protein
MGLTVITIALERERVWSEHPAVEVTTQVTTSPLLREVVVKTLALGPTGTELMYHRYEGEGPALLGVATKVTGCPWQMLVAEAVIETVGRGCTTIVMGLEMEPGPEQPLVLVTTQRMT